MEHGAKRFSLKLRMSTTGLQKQSRMNSGREGTAKKMTDAPDESKRIEVRAPMSGIFYRKSAPDQPAYVEVGDTVKKKQVLALLETMKVFQKVKCPVNGKIVEIIAENETPLKDDDLMFVIESA
jgi:acetyl-CoA carboxylase biotin carboxyl carrier protein